MNDKDKKQLFNRVLQHLHQEQENLSLIQNNLQSDTLSRNITSIKNDCNILQKDLIESNANTISDKYF